MKCIIVYHHPVMMLPKEVGMACSSTDGINSTSGKRCTDCQFNQFGSGENGHKLCQCFRKIYYINNTNDTEIKTIEISGKDLFDFSEYVLKVIQLGLQTKEVITNIKETNDKKTFLIDKKIKGKKNIEYIAGLNVRLRHAIQGW